MLVGGDRNVLQWDVDSTDPKKVHQLESSTNLLFSSTRHPVFTADGERIVYLTTQEKPEVYVWETGSGRQVSKFSVDFLADRSERAYTVSPDGKLIATLEGFHVQKVWNVENAAEIADLGQVPRTLTWPYRYVAFSPDGSKLARAIRLPGAAGDANEFQVEVFNLATKRVTVTQRTIDFRSMAFAGDGMRFAVADTDRTTIFNHATGEKLATIGDRQSAFTDLAFSQSGDILCAVSADHGSVTLWDTNTSSKLATFQTQHDNLIRVAISPNAQWLAVVASNGNVQLWNLMETRQQLRQVGLDWSN
jgi:WD40 repeat protein